MSTLELQTQRDELLVALQEATDVLEILRRGHGVDVSAACYPALNHCRDVLARCAPQPEDLP